VRLRQDGSSHGEQHPPMRAHFCPSKHAQHFAWYATHTQPSTLQGLHEERKWRLGQAQKCNPCSLNLPTNNSAGPLLRFNAPHTTPYTTPYTIFWPFQHFVEPHYATLQEHATLLQHHTATSCLALASHIMFRSRTPHCDWLSHPTI